MSHWLRYLPAIVVLLLLLWMHFRMGGWLMAAPAFRRSRLGRRAVRITLASLVALLSCGLILGIPGIVHALPAWPWIPWVRAAAIAWALGSIGLFFAALLWRRLPKFEPGRRQAMRLAGGALLAAPFAATAFGVLVERLNIRIREANIYIPGLPEDLEGLRLVQLSDIHLGPFLSEKELAEVVDMANDLQGHVAVITGDFITGPGDPLDACLRQLARLRSDAGILGCLGNHEGYAGVEDYTARRGGRLGIDFLRSEARLLRFGAASLNIAGVDYQRYYRPYLEGARDLKAPDAVNVLLSHNPDVFSAAAEQGWNLTLAGHTHGGQVNFEILSRSVNFARFYTPFVYGVYRTHQSSIYVTRGIGTVGIPARIGAPPEVALIRLTGRGETGPLS